MNYDFFQTSYHSIVYFYEINLLLTLVAAETSTQAPSITEIKSDNTVTSTNLISLMTKPGTTEAPFTSIRDYFPTTSISELATLSPTPNNYLTPSNLRTYLKRMDLFMPYGVNFGDAVFRKGQTNMGPIRLMKNFTDFANNLISDFNISLNGYLYNNFFRIVPLMSDFSLDSDEGNIFYRQTNNPLILYFINYIINNYFSYQYDYDWGLNWALVVTWSNLSITNDPACLNTFQAIVTSTADCDLFIIYLYKNLNIRGEVKNRIHAGFDYPILKKDIIRVLDYPASLPKGFVYRVDESIITKCF